MLPTFKATIEIIAEENDFKIIKDRIGYYDWLNGEICKKDYPTSNDMINLMKNLVKIYDPRGINDVRPLLHIYSSQKEGMDKTCRELITNSLVNNCTEEQLRTIHSVEDYISPDDCDFDLIIKTTEKLYLPKDEWEHLR